jgi:hypothetical protein
MDLEQFLRTQIEWSRKTHGEGQRTEGLCRYAEKELAEIRACPNDPFEWLDLAILALDGAWRSMVFSRDAPCHQAYAARKVPVLLLEKALINYFHRERPEPGPETDPVERVRAKPTEPARHCDGCRFSHCGTGLCEHPSQRGKTVEATDTCRLHRFPGELENKP